MKICDGVMKGSAKETGNVFADWSNRTHHVIIVFDGEGPCPLCEKEREIDRLQMEIEALRGELKIRVPSGSDPGRVTITE